MNLTFASALAIVGLLTSPFLAAAPQEEQTGTSKQNGLVRESEVGLTLFAPKVLETRELMNYAVEMTGGVFLVQLESGAIDQRERFIDMTDAIGIQGTEGKRAKLSALLEGIDARIGEMRSETDTDSHIHDLRTMRMRCMSVDSAVLLVSRLGLPVNVAPVQETGNLILEGPRGALDKVQEILTEADKPLPQLTMHCEVIEAFTPADSDRTPIAGDVAKALEAINPGKKFARRAHMLLRSSVGGQKSIEIASTIARSFNEVSESPTKPRMTFSCVPSGWDPESQTLTLDDCSALLQVPVFQEVGNGNERIKQFTGYTEQGISSRLSLKAGETTVIGSLGGDPVYVSVRFTVR